MRRAVAFHDQRRVDRDEVFCRTSVTIGRSPPARAVLVDLSPLGGMVRCEALAEPGTPILIKLPGLGDVQATVAWSIMGRIGMAFDRVIPMPDYDALLAKTTLSGLGRPS